jgi:hypothetical protein
VSGITYGAKQKPFQCPPVPAYFTGQQTRAFSRGFDWYVRHHREGTLATADGVRSAHGRYQQRWMRAAFLEGWDAAKRLDT